LKKITVTFVILISILSATLSFASDRLRVQNPQTRRFGTGTIEEAVLSVRPQGLYMEFGLYLTFSARGLNFSDNEQLEVQFFFDLPEDVIVTDLWLWVGDDIMRALILDRWTASSIYENIVNRRRDPAILFKNDENSYELRVYPMKGNETRKIKLTYLMPTQWLSNSVISSLPTSLLRTSKNKLPVFHLLSWPKNQWSNPQVLESPETPFKNVFDQNFGSYKQADIPSDALNSSLSFSLNSPMKDGIFLSRLDNGNEGLYQLAFLPSKVFDFGESRSTAILFDYDAIKSNENSDEVINTAKLMLHENFNENDSFNLIFSGSTVYRASDSWLPADSTTIEDVFKNLGENPIAQYSSLPALLQNGIDFVTANRDTGNILLISNSDQLGDYRTANPLIMDLIGSMQHTFPINVADFTNTNYSRYHFGNRSYNGNEYFYDNITKQTKGVYSHIRSGISFSELLSLSFQSLTGLISSFDLHTTLLNGFCYGRFSFLPVNNSISLNSPIVQVGRYNGTFPFLILASGVYNSEVFSYSIEIPENRIVPSDSLIEEIWTGKYIKYLESQVQSNDIISEIVELSINERVLSLYTAFLALEPSDTVKACLDCVDETQAVTGVDLEEIKSDTDSLLQAYPNPFNDNTIIKISLPETIDTNELSLKIYNVMGQVVRTFEPNLAENRNSFQLIWNGRNDNGQTIASGSYFFVMTTKVKRYSLKLLLLK